MSLDGKIATKRGRARISSPEDMQRMQELRATVDGIMVGINTILVDDPSLRLKVEKEGEPPARIIVDSRLRMPPDARIFSYPGRIIIGTTENVPLEKFDELSRKAEIIKTMGDRVDLVELLGELHRCGIGRLLLEGGGNLNWGMLSERLVDEIRIAISPVIIGGRDAVTLVEGEGADDMSNALKLSLMDITLYGRDVVMSFKTDVNE
jgi:2,5-diamino-6-(ribosylamino)-4(3H)-pyrimidinone 5'-phosphate reductase